MKYIISTILILASLLSCSDDFDNVTLETTTIAKGVNYSYQDTEESVENIVIANSIHWNNIKSQIPASELLEDSIDFNAFTVLAIIDQVQNTGGYHVEITSVVEQEDEIIANVNYAEPSDTNGVTLALTRPYHFVKVNKIDKTVEFSN